MCGTENPKNAQTCKFCGYIFENFDTGQIDTSNKNVPAALNQVPSSRNEDSSAEPGSEEKFPDMTASSSTVPIPTMGSGAPAFVVSKSVLSSILPSIVYLVFILVFTTSAGISIYSLAITLIFIAVALVPVLFSPRRFEFYDDEVKVHKTIGGDTLIPYSDIAYNYAQRGNRSQVVLSSISRRMRPLVVPGNPANKDLGMDLNQFLEKKVRKPGTETPGAKNASSSNPNIAENNSVSNPDSANGYEGN
jgi:hypothetical protein